MENLFNWKVQSDVIVPDSYMPYLMEKDEENPLAWDKIDPAMYNPWINEQFGFYFF